MSESRRPLSGVRVLDLGCYIAGPLTGMLLADQGAEVIKVDPPGGPLFDHGVNAVLNRGKLRIAADLHDPSDRSRVLDLLRNADVVIENFSPDARARLRVTADDVHAVNPDAIHVSLPGVASGDDLLEGAEAFEGIVAAATAQFTNIHAVRELFGLDPVYTPLPLASVYAGVHAATAAVLALRERAGRHGRGTAIEVPLVNAAVSAMSSLHLKVERQPDRYAAPRLPLVLRRVALPLMRLWARTGGPQAQAKLLAIARQSYPALMTSYPCGDGHQLYLFAVDNAKLARAALDVLGILDKVLAEGFVFQDPYVAGDRRDNLSEASNLSRKRQTRLKQLIAEALLARPAEEWEALLNRRGVTCAVQRTTAEWLALPEIAAAGLVTALEDPELGVVRQPGPQAVVRTDLGRTTYPRPRRPQVQPEDSCWAERQLGPARQHTAPRTAGPANWLNDLLVVDMCSMVAGPVAGRTFAEYGARVVKVESPRPNHGPRLTCWYGLDVNQGKESIALDLKSVEGREAARRLIARADVLLTNHSTAAMDALGLDTDGLRALNPRLLICRIGAYNALNDGPWSARPGYDPVLQAASGIMMRYGDPGNPELHAIASCVDALTGYSAAFGAAVALFAQGERGGGSVDASLAAAATLVQIPFAFDHGALARAEPSGQTAKGETDSYRLYRASDGWIFIGARGNNLGAISRALRTTRVDREALERAIASRRVSSLTKALRAAGIPAVRVETVASLHEKLAGKRGPGLRLEHHEVPGLGRVVVAPGQQVTSDGGLCRLAAAQKPGASTGPVLEQLGLDAQTFLNSGAAANEIAHDYLPA